MKISQLNRQEKRLIFYLALYCLKLSVLVKQFGQPISKEATWTTDWALLEQRLSWTPDKKELEWKLHRSYNYNTWY